jgi:hypothetical protein
VPNKTKGEKNYSELSTSSENIYTLGMVNGAVALQQWCV